jgi:hypothetical protein
MILSRAHGFIFIKGLKVGGTSVEIALSTICGTDDIVTPITPIDELKRIDANGGAQNYSGDRMTELAYLETLRRTAVLDLVKLPVPVTAYFNHMSLRDVLRLQGPTALDYQVICVERHPYAKILSWANHQLSFAAYEVGGEMRSDWHELKILLNRAVEDGRILAVKNIDRYRGPNNSISAHVIRFENLISEFRQFTDTLGLDRPLVLPHAKKGILANNLDPRDLLDKRQISLINEMFLEEFETFNYNPL